MTPKQARTVEILTERLKDKNVGIGATEIKKLEITESADTDLVFMTIVIGHPKDEGTLASILCRDHRHIMIGKNGGCELLNRKEGGRTTNRGIWHCVYNLTSY